MGIICFLFFFNAYSTQTDVPSNRESSWYELQDRLCSRLAREVDITTSGGPCVVKMHCS